MISNDTIQYVHVQRAYPHEMPIPIKQTSGAAGYDLMASEDMDISCDEQKLIGTGFIFSIPHGYVGLIKDRSSMAMKEVYTSAGVIDSDYRGEVKVLIRNANYDLFKIKKGDRIAQLIILKLCEQKMIEVNSLVETSRAGKGFGSTGK